MCQQLRQIYDKKSPVFLIEIATLVATIILIWKYPCTCFLPITTFYKIVLGISSSQILMKTLILAIIYCASRQIAYIAQSFITIVYLLLHIAIWIYAIILRSNSEFQNCRNQEPHYFFMYYYVVVYSIMIVGSIALIVIMLLPATVLTVFTLKKSE